MRYFGREARTALAGLFLLQALLLSSVVLAQEAVPVMTLADGTKVAMTQAQFNVLVTQPGIAYTPAGTVSELAATQMAVPVPTALGGGFVVGEPAAIAAGMNAVAVTAAATGTSVAGATAATGSVSAGAAAAGAAAAGGIGAGTIGVGAGILAAGAAAAAAGGGGGGGGGGGTTTTHHH